VKVGLGAAITVIVLVGARVHTQTGEGRGAQPIPNGDVVDPAKNALPNPKPRVSRPFSGGGVTQYLKK
jgi:hypothetical protein